MVNPGIFFARPRTASLFEKRPLAQVDKQIEESAWSRDSRKTRKSLTELKRDFEIYKMKLRNLKRDV
jgi:hypothetical protein